MTPRYSPAVWKKSLIRAMIVFALPLVGWSLLSPGTALSSSQQVSASAVAGIWENRQLDQKAWPHETSDLDPDPAVVLGRLANGLRYALMPNQRPQNRVSVHLYIRAGSLNETESQRGLAHFLEHMLFNGSTHFPPGELIRYFQSIGMQFGNDANAHTGFDETVYDIILPTGDEQNLKKGLLVMHDYAMGALLLEEEVKRESGVILAEMRSRDSSSYRTFAATLQFEFPDMLISRRLPIGQASVVKNADREQLKHFYDTWYRPDNMVLVMVGDFSIPLARRLIEDQFKDIAPRAPATPSPSLGTIGHKGLQVFFHHEPEAGGTTVSIETIRMQPPVPDSRAFQRQQLIADMADAIVQNRLDAKTTSPGAPFTAAAIGSGIYLGRIRYAEISADCDPGSWPQALAEMEQELRRARLFGFTAPELERVKKEFLNMLDNAVKKAPTRDSTSLARAIIGHFSRNRVFQSPQQEKAILAPMIEAATLAEIHRAFHASWPHDHRLVLVSGKADANTFANGEVENRIRDLFLASAATVVQPPAVETASAFPYLPPPENSGTIVSRETIADLGITRVRLGNGVRLNVKHTDYKASEVLASLVFGSGRRTEPESLPGIALLSEATIDESGFGAMDANQLKKALAGKSTYVDFRIRETHCSLFAESVPAEIELMFQLIRTQLMDPGFSEDALERVRKRFRQEYRSLSRSIDGMMRIEGLRYLAGGDSRFGMPPLEKIQGIHLNDIWDWITPQLTQAPLELSVVGDIDENRVIELARRYLGSLPRRDQPLGRTRNNPPALPMGTVKKIPVNTQIPKAMVVAAWQTEDFWDIHRTRRLSVLADIFSERLRQHIREKLGASYSPYAYNRSSRAYDGYGIFQAVVSVAPDQTERVLREVNAIAAGLATEGMATEELTRTIDPIITSIKELRQTNGYWLNSVMSGSSRHPQQIEWARSFLGDFSAVTVEELNQLAATYLTANRSASLIIEPVKKAGD